MAAPSASGLGRSHLRTLPQVAFRLVLERHRDHDPAMRDAQHLSQHPRRRRWQVFEPVDSEHAVGGPVGQRHRRRVPATAKTRPRKSGSTTAHVGSTAASSDKDEHSPADKQAFVRSVLPTTDAVRLHHVQPGPNAIRSAGSFGYVRKPARRAAWMVSTRLRVPNLRMAFLRYVLTVVGMIDSCSATSLLVWPSAIAAST